ncbi:Outer membrane lipoprotein carrier protein LolA [Catenovulum agarivorans DS-2]|uniref:Outer membrane lipoprotein carrier protein LolA n=1 Tax=Catenovulum agarivorans DS-2 TaxID=1328313 RepID=W7QNT0_9ALTE|nr:hypothetical protein [Catenovulum agarivorans]EWH10612.1 Outer membrane lipoprotein carrier protein LolA [Catenovulum agarivorans DS-2]
MATAATSWQTIDTQQLKQSLAPFNNFPVKGSFVQSKKLKFLTVPIRSSGNFAIDKVKSELLWHQQTPVEQQTKINQQGIFQQKQGQNNFVKVVDDSVISQLLLAIFTGDITTEDWFLWQRNPAEAGCIKSDILSADLSQYVQSIKLCHLQNVLQITLSENQVETLIELTEHKEE